MANSSPTGANGHVDPGVSIRFGAVEDKDVKMEDAGDDALSAGKRKSRASIGGQKSYAEAESSEEDEPLVCLTHRVLWPPLQCHHSLLLQYLTIR